MSSTENLLNLLLHEKEMPEEIRDSIKQRAEDFWEGITGDAGNFLHFELNDNKHTQDEVKKMVQRIPESLSYEADHDRIDSDEPTAFLPIQAAVWDYGNLQYNFEAISFIPLLAEEGVKTHVGEEGTRGGLLQEDVQGEHALEILLLYSDDDDDMAEHADLVCLDVIKRLRQMDLFKKEDIKKHSFLPRTCHIATQKRFEYLVDWNPSALKTLLLPEIITGSCFEVALEAGLKYFPKELGLLCKKNSDGETVMEDTYHSLGENEAWHAIKYCLDRIDIEKVLGRDSDANIYPFMLASEGPSVHLDVMYYLLRKDPSRVINDARCMEGSFHDDDGAMTMKE